MRISVVIIVFNLEDYVRDAIDSVVAQTRKADEIIVVDDCSTDRSGERVRAYGHKIRYLRMSQNSGALLAALRGVKAATGDVVCMLDGDDFWETNKLEVVEQAFAADGDLLLLSHNHVRVDDRGAEMPGRDDTHRNIASILTLARSNQELSNLLRRTILNQRGFWLGSAYSFRKSLFDIPKFEMQIEAFGRNRLKQAYLDLVIAPFLVLTNPLKRIAYAGNTRLFYRVHDKGSLAGNVSAEAAKRSALKGKIVNELIAVILRKNDAAPEYLRRRELILQHYDYLAALYSKQVPVAMQLYARLAWKLWGGNQLVKETKRLVAVLILGPDRFLRLAHKRSDDRL
jgi:glycosyltransferase involved in cell wall biosynthesis